MNGMYQRPGSSPGVGATESSFSCSFWCAPSNASRIIERFYGCCICQLKREGAFLKSLSRILPSIIALMIFAVADAMEQANQTAGLPLFCAQFNRQGLCRQSICSAVPRLLLLCVTLLLCSSLGRRRGVHREDVGGKKKRLGWDGE